MNMKTAFLLGLALFAFATTTIAVSSIPIPKLFNISKSETESIDSLVQPLGDPIDGDQFPHLR